jgi:hypothetical protein
VRLTVLTVNFNDLLHAYYYGTAAASAAEHLSRLIQGRDEKSLKSLLRDYRVAGVYSKREIDLRAAVDRLLNCYSVLELASFTGFIENVGHTDLGQRARTILGSPQVQSYYEEFYPLNLPRLFRLRINDRWVERTTFKAADVLFLGFLELDRRFMKLEDGVFLRMLDSFWFSGFGFRDVVAAISEPRVFLRYVLEPDDSDVIGKALQQFSSFMEFCFDFDRLLARSHGDALLSSTIWNHYSYWFDIIGESLRHQLGQALGRFLKWAPPNDGEAAIEIQEYVKQARDVLNRLTSGIYAKPVATVLARLA